MDPFFLINSFNFAASLTAVAVFLLYLLLNRNGIVEIFDDVWQLLRDRSHACACYNFEDDLTNFSPEYSKSLGVSEAEKLIRRISNDNGIEAPLYQSGVDIGVASGTYNRKLDKIFSRDKEITKGVLIHEMAHAVALKGGYADKKALPHGPEFMQILLPLYAQHLNISLKELEDMAQKHGAKFERQTEPDGAEGPEAVPA